MARCRTIVSHVAPEGFEPGVCRALRTLGYEIVAAGNERAPADLWLVDDERYEIVAAGNEQAHEHFAIASHTGSTVPVILLTRDPEPPPEDPCVVDMLRSPARFCSLYAALQTALEATPRRFPRVTTACPTWSVAGDQICAGTVNSLSEGGCLFRGHPWEPPCEPESRLYLSLPRHQTLTLRARTTYQMGSELGQAFQGVGSAVRAAIGGYVLDQLLAE